MKKIYILTILISLIFAACKDNTSTAYYRVKNDETLESNFKITNYKNIKELQGKLNTIGKNETPSVVFISTEKTITQNSYDPFDFFYNKPENRELKKKEFKQQGLGSGVIYKRKNNNYYIITNNHVIEGADDVKITLDQTKFYNGEVVGTDAAVDIAVVKINTKDDLITAKIGDSGNIEVGDFVVAIGNPFGLNGTMTFGIVSAIGRSNLNTGRLSLTDFIQTDAAINPGNSGGPLINIEGEVIGINTLIYSQSGGNVGIGFAVPINIAQKTAEYIIKNGSVEHGFLGIYFEELTDEKIDLLGIKDISNGMLVKEVIKNSPAEKYGIKAGDIILELDGKKVIKMNELVYTIGKSIPGAKIIFTIIRNNKKMKKEVVLGKRTDNKISKR